MLNRTWDKRVVYLEGRQCWWWNAYHVEIKELYGTADSKEAAWAALEQAVRAAEAAHDRTSR